MVLYSASPPTDESPFNRADVFSEIREHSQIIPVANATARAQLLTDLANDGVTPSLTAPIYVDQTDVSTIYRHVGGAGWERVSAIPVPRIERGSRQIVAASGDTQRVVAQSFTTPYTTVTGLIVLPNLANAESFSAGWHVRAINITTAGFDWFLFGPSTSGGTFQANFVAFGD